MAKHRAPESHLPQTADDYLDGMIQAIEADFQKVEYHSLQEIRREVNKEMNQSRRAFRKARGESFRMPNPRADGKIGERRAAALAEHMLRLQEKADQKYPHLNAVKHYIFMDSVPLHSFENLEFRKGLLAGAAVWILDELDRMHRMPEAGLCLTHDADEFMEVDLASMTIPGIDDDLLRSMLHLIWHRNDQPEKKRFTPSHQYDIHTEAAAVRHEPMSYTRPQAAEDEQPADMKERYEGLTPREKFDAVISMLSETRIRRAVDRYRASMDSFDDFFLDVENFWHRKTRKYADALIREIRGMRDRNNPLFAQAQPVSPLLANPMLRSPQAMAAPPLFAPSSEPMLDVLDRLEARMEKYSEQKQKWEHALLSIDLAFDLRWSRMDLETLGETADSIQARLPIGNPFEICFAFLYLLDSGNDLPWIDSASYAVMSKAASLLPWGQMTCFYEDLWEEEEEEDESEDPDEDDPEEDDSEDGEAVSDVSEGDNGSEEDPPVEDAESAAAAWTPEDVRKQYQEILENPRDLIEEEKELYQPRYRRIDANWREEHFGVPPEKCSIAQYIFETTGVILPRNIRASYEVEEEFMEDGFTEAEAKIMRQLSNLASDIDRVPYNWSESLYSYKDEEEDAPFVPADDAEAKEEADDAQAVEALKKQNKALKAELDRLHHQIREMHQQRRETEQEMARLREENRRDHQELADLRNVVLLQEQEEQETGPAEKDILLPYEPTHRTVVFGGHDTWLKAIRPMLPKVRFIDKDMVPNAGMLRHMEMVWIQPNALSHSFYYKIMDMARQSGIPVRYFTHASAEKCARQLAAEDERLRGASPEG